MLFRVSTTVQVLHTCCRRTADGYDIETERKKEIQYSKYCTVSIRRILYSTVGQPQHKTERVFLLFY
jgi:hypothetical protein